MSRVRLKMSFPPRTKRKKDSRNTMAKMKMKTDRSATRPRFSTTLRSQTIPNNPHNLQIRRRMGLNRSRNRLPRNKRNQSRNKPRILRNQLRPSNPLTLKRLGSKSKSNP
jgi:hypothetical protein